jgi:hypothetical protein
VAGLFVPSRVGAKSICCSKLSHRTCHVHASSIMNYSQIKASFSALTRIAFSGRFQIDVIQAVLRHL